MDDKSEMQHLHETLDEELRKPFYQSKVKVVRNKEREGLIRARNNGAVYASGLSFYVLLTLSISIFKGPRIFFELVKDSNYGESFVRLSKLRGPSF